jgi:hypothetical protein
MRLNHINLCASDVPAMARTLEQHFDYDLFVLTKVTEQMGVLEPGSDFAMLTGLDGSYVVISQIDPTPDGSSAYPSFFHFGVMQDSADAVHAKHAELEAAGYHPGAISDGFEVAGATWTAFYCEIGDGLEVEVNHRTWSEQLDGPRQDGAHDDARSGAR